MIREDSDYIAFGIYTYTFLFFVVNSPGLFETNKNPTFLILDRRPPSGPKSPSKSVKFDLALIGFGHHGGVVPHRSRWIVDVFFVFFLHDPTLTFFVLLIFFVWFVLFDWFCVFSFVHWQNDQVVSALKGCFQLVWGSGFQFCPMKIYDSLWWVHNTTQKLLHPWEVHLSSMWVWRWTFTRIGCWLFPPPPSKSLAWLAGKIHHEWVDVVPTETWGFSSQPPKPAKIKVVHHQTWESWRSRSGCSGSQETEVVKDVKSLDVFVLATLVGCQNDSSCWKSNLEVFTRYWKSTANCSLIGTFKGVPSLNPKGWWCWHPANGFPCKAPPFETAGSWINTFACRQGHKKLCRIHTSLQA